MVKPTEEEDRKTVIFGGGGKGETLDRSTVSVPVTKPYPPLCDLMVYSTSGFPVLHCLLEFAQTHAHWVGDAIQRSKDLMYSNITVISNTVLWTWDLSKIWCSSVQFNSVAQSCPTLCDPISQTSLSITNSWSLLKLMSIKSVMPSSHLILCRLLLLLPPLPPSIRVFSNESALRMRWPKYWSFSLSISPSSEHPGLIFFRMDWLDLLAVQGTLKSLLQLTIREKEHDICVKKWVY